MAVRFRSTEVLRVTARTGVVAGTDHITLRAAVLSDAEALGAIEQTVFADPWPVSAFRDLITATHARVTVAVDANDAAVGYCVLLSAADEAEIANIAVSSTRRRSGVAARLLDASFETAKSLGVTEMFLEVRLSNVGARGLYASRGFTQVGRRPSYYRFPTEDALVLRLVI